MAVPLNRKLYNEVLADAKKRFKKWPSAYASGWVVRHYKLRGGRYSDKPSYTDTDLKRWFDEKWINVCELPRIVPCGRRKASMDDYPYCRPMNRVSKKTPKTVGELSAKELKERCSRKKRDPMRRVLPSG